MTARKDKDKTMNQEQINLAQKGNIMTNPVLFSMLDLEKFYRELPETNKSKIGLKTFNQTGQRKEEQTIRVNKPSIAIDSFACLCPACSTS